MAKEHFRSPNISVPGTEFAVRRNHHIVKELKWVENRNVWGITSIHDHGEEGYTAAIGAAQRSNARAQISYVSADADNNNILDQRFGKVGDTYEVIKRKKAVTIRHGENGREGESVDGLVHTPEDLASENADIERVRHRNLLKFVT